MNYYFSCFLFYSFLGFLIEVFYSRIKGFSKLDRKCFLLAPLCPVYGFGALAVLALPDFILCNPLLLIPLGGCAATVAEYCVALFYEGFVGIQFWSYTDEPYNLSGRVCLRYTLYWGILAASLATFLQPMVAGMLLSIPQIPLLFYALWLGADSVVTFVLLSRHGDTDILRWYVQYLPSGAIRGSVPQDFPSSPAEACQGGRGAL